MSSKTAMKTIRTWGLLALLAFSLLFPLIFSDATITTIAIFTLILMVAATGWNLFSGYTRYLSLGHAAFYGLGAYILAAFCQVWNVQGGLPPLLLLPLVGLVTGLCALPLGWIALQTRRYTFMVITIAIFALVALLPNLLSGVIPQISTIYLPTPLWNADIFNYPFYYTALLLLFCALAVSWGIRSSKFGLCLLAIGDDEDRALGLGNKTKIHKLIAWTISATFVGMAGALNIYYLGSLNPTTAFDPNMNIALSATTFIGGLGTLGGPLIGTLLIGPLQQYLTLQFGNIQGLDLVLYGGLLLVVIFVLPQGVGPTIKKQLFGMLANRNQINAVPGSPAFATLPVTPFYEMRSNMEPQQSFDPLAWSTSQNFSGPLTSTRSGSLSSRKGYDTMKSPRLVPLPKEGVMKTTGEHFNTGS